MAYMVLVLLMAYMVQLSCRACTADKAYMDYISGMLYMEHSDMD
jgi:hypothetical protein